TLARTETKKARRESLAYSHARALSLCATGAESYMRRFCPDEVATITAEDNTHTKTTVDLMHNAFRGMQPAYADWVRQIALNMGLGEDFYPITKLRDE